MRLSIALLALVVLSSCSEEPPVALGPDSDRSALERAERSGPNRVGLNPSLRYVSAPIPPIHPIPSPAQLRYQELELNTFIHFGLNTFTNAEWGDGTADPALFNPTDLDATQWMRILKDVGVKGVLFVAKHHDGFLLWPSAHSEYSVKNSPWRNGKGDVVAEVAEATRNAGLEFGLYLSPWDRNHPSWGTASYNNYFLATLWELMGWDNYGTGALFQVWFDQGHDMTIVTQEQIATYDMPRWIREVRLHQPGAVIGPEWDTFYTGNELGLAPETNWSVRDNFHLWAPYECDTPLRAEHSWFWHPQDDPKPLDHLVDVYFTTVGRACTLHLAVGPDQRGLIAAEDETRLREWRAALDGIFDEDLAFHATTSASSVRPGSAGWAAGAAVDGDPSSFWAADDRTGWIEVDLGRPETVNILELAEPIRYGQRIAAFRLEAWTDTEWTTVVRGTTVNYKRLVRFEPFTAQRWRVVIDDARAAPALSQFGLYSALDWAAAWSDAAGS